MFFKVSLLDWETSSSLVAYTCYICHSNILWMQAISQTEHFYMRLDGMSDNTVCSKLKWILSFFPDFKTIYEKSPEVNFFSISFSNNDFLQGFGSLSQLTGLKAMKLTQPFRSNFRPLPCHFPPSKLSKADSSWDMLFWETKREDCTTISKSSQINSSIADK